MVKTIIGGIAVQQYITHYSCRCPPVTGNNSFFDVNGNWISDKKGNEVILNISLEGVPTSVSQELAKALEADSVDVEYTTPIPAYGTFYKTDYNATCDDADPDNPDYEDTSNIEWSIQLSLRSTSLNAVSGSL